MTLPFHSAYFSFSCFLSILLWLFVCFLSLSVMFFFRCILFSSLLYSIALSVFFLYLTIRKSAELLYPSHCALTSFTIVCLLRNWLRKGRGRERKRERERRKDAGVSVMGQNIFWTIQKTELGKSSVIAMTPYWKDLSLVHFFLLFYFVKLNCK